MNDFKDQGEYDEATFRAELEGKFDYVRYIFADIPGTCRHKLIPVRHAVKAVETSMYSGRSTERKCCHFADISIAGCTGSCQNRGALKRKGRNFRHLLYRNCQFDITSGVANDENFAKIPISGLVRNQMWL